MFIKTVFLTATCILQVCFAQQRTIDSLLNELKAHEKEDTIRLKVLNELAFNYYQVSPARGLALADELITLSKKLGNSKYEAFGYFNKGINCGAKGDYNEALAAYKSAGEILTKQGARKKVANLNNSIAIVYQKLSNYPGALELYLQNLHFFENEHDSRMTAITYGNIGLVYEHMGQYEKAITAHSKAIDFNEKSGDTIAIAQNYGNIGNVYDSKKDVPNALKYYGKALEISRMAGYEKGIAINLTNMGIASTTAGLYADAYKYLSQSLPVSKKLEDLDNEAAALMTIGKIFLNADANFFSENKIPFSKRFELANNYLDSSLLLLQKLEDVEGQAQVWKELSILYEKQLSFGKSLDAYKKFVVMKDSVFNDEKKDAITRLELNYTFTKKEDSIKVLHEKEVLMAAAEIKRQSTIKKAFAWGGALLLIASLISFIFYKKRRDAKQKQQEAEFKTEVADTEMKALRAQMNPHFIFNSLNSIGDYIAKNNVQEADRYLGKFAKLMRLILENSEKKEVPLSDDLKALELYMQLEALRMNNKFVYEIKVDEAIDQEITMIPPLILQPFVENSIWHGIAKKEGSGKISIHIRKEAASMINCIVEDDGIGRKRSAAEKTITKRIEKSSLGMKITQTRIDILNKIKNTAASVHLFDLDQGLRVEVKLPLLTSF